MCQVALIVFIRHACFCAVWAGGLGILWFTFWLFLSHETPSQHPDINEDELMMMKKEQGESAIVYEVSIGMIHGCGHAPYGNLFNSGI